MTLDLTAACRFYAGLEAELEDPRHRAIVKNARLHLQAQLLGDADGLLALLSPDFTFRTYGSEQAKDTMISGSDQVRVLYQGMLEAGLGLLEIEFRDVTASDDALGNRAICHHVVSGGFPAGVPARILGEIDDPGANYLVTYNAAWFVRFDQSDPPLMTAEYMFVDDFSTTVCRLRPGDHVITRAELSPSMFDL